MSSTCKEIKFHGWNDAMFHLSQENHQILFEFQQNRWALSSNTNGNLNAMLNEFSQNRKYLMSLLAETKGCIIQATKFKVKLILLDTSSIFTNILKYPIQSECKPPICSISIIDLWVFSLRLGLGLQIWIQIKGDLLHSTTNESLGVLLCYALWIHWYPVISPPGSFATNWLATKKK